MNIIGIVILCLLCACICSLLKRYNGEYALLLAFAAGALILWQVIDALQESKETVSMLLESAEGAENYFSILWKGALICMITRFASDSCADSGQKALASQVELAGKAAVIAMALPLFTSLTEVILSFAGG